MPMNWNAEAGAKLFAAVIKVHNIKLDYAALAAEMGPGCTPKAITHRIGKIKSNTTTSNNPSAPTTPAKRVRAPAAPKSTPKTPTSTPKHRNKRSTPKPASYALSAESTMEDDEDDVFVEAKEAVDWETPSKKIKVEVALEGVEGV